MYLSLRIINYFPHESYKRTLAIALVCLLDLQLFRKVFPVLNPPGALTSMYVIQSPDCLTA